MSEPWRSHDPRLLPALPLRSGRKRAKGEMNGKSCNINNAMRQIYPVGVNIPLTEVRAALSLLL